MISIGKAAQENLPLNLNLGNPVTPSYMYSQCTRCTFPVLMNNLFKTLPIYIHAIKEEEEEEEKERKLRVGNGFVDDDSSCSISSGRDTRLCDVSYTRMKEASPTYDALPRRREQRRMWRRVGWAVCQRRRGRGCRQHKMLMKNVETI